MIDLTRRSFGRGLLGLGTLGLDRSAVAQVLSPKPGTAEGNLLPAELRSGQSEGNWQRRTATVLTVPGETYRLAIPEVFTTAWTHFAVDVGGRRHQTIRSDDDRQPTSVEVGFRADGASTEIVLGADGRGTGQVEWRGAALNLANVSGDEGQVGQRKSEAAPFGMFINIAGAEFGEHRGDQIWKDYTYPSEEEIRGILNLAGWQGIRYPILWRRVQRAVNGPLSPEDLQPIKKAAAFVTGLGKVFILDSHDYLRRSGSGGSDVIGRNGPSADAYADFFAALAREIGPNPLVWYNWNEPYEVPAALPFRVAQTVISKLRGAGAEGKILVPGTAWTGAHSWLSSGNAAAYDANPIRDPKNNWAFDMHQYFDSNSSGTQAFVSSGAGRRVERALAWCKQRDLTVFVGEWAFPDEVDGHREAATMLSLLKESGVCLGAAYWAAGPWWPNEWNIVGPGRPNGQLRTISQFA